MNDRRLFWAAVVSTVMWATVLLLCVTFMRLEDVSALGAAFFILALAGTAVGGTAAVWSSAAVSAPVGQSQDDAAQQARKAKRLDPDLLARLVESLDDDQIIELETLLLSQRDDRLNDV